LGVKVNVLTRDVMIWSGEAAPPTVADDTPVGLTGVATRASTGGEVKDDGSSPLTNSNRRLHAVG
jgi:hypothetical protein